MSTLRRKLVVAGTALGVGAAVSVALGSARDLANHDDDDAPHAGKLKQKPRIAWVFSSGGPRGFTHVGVLKALAELGLEPDVYVGSSVGAFVGTLAAAGMSAAEMESVALDLNLITLLRPSFVGQGYLSGRAIGGYVDRHLRELGTRQTRLEALRKPAVCVAMRLRDRQLMPFTHGDGGLAVQAAAAIEGQFVPVRIHGERHVDSDLVMPMPVRVALELGATRVLSVDASAYENEAPPGSEAYRDSDRRKRELTQPDTELATVSLHPKFDYWVSTKRDWRLRSLEAGYRAAMSQAQAIQAMHA